MDKINHYIWRRKDSETISIEYLEKNVVYECSYEQFENEFLARLTPEELINKDEEKAKFDNEIRDCSYEELTEKLLEFLDKKEPTTYVKDLRAEGSILKIECYNLDDAAISNGEIFISSELLDDQKFADILSLIVRTFVTNKNALIKQFYIVKKIEENKELVAKCIQTYLDNNEQLCDISEEEAIIIDMLINSMLEDGLKFFDGEYRPNHPLKAISCFGLPLVTGLIILEHYLPFLYNIYAAYIYGFFISGTYFIESKVWNQIAYSKFMEFKRKLEEKYNISYDLDQKRIVLNNPRDFYDPYTKCIKSTLELAYSKITTPLEDEIGGLCSLLNEYQDSKNTSQEKVYFITGLLRIKKQILLKENCVDKKYCATDDEIKFVKQCIKYLTGKDIAMLDDEKINSCLEKIKQYEKKKMYIYIVDLMMGLASYIYENYLKKEEVIETKKSEEESLSDIEEAVNMALGMRFDGKNLN